MAMDPATAAQQQADDAQRSVEQAKARISDLERLIRETQDALNQEKAILNDQVRTAQMAQNNATRVKAAESYILSSAARGSNPPNPVI